MQKIHKNSMASHFVPEGNTCEIEAPIGSTNCTLGVETVLFFRVNELSNVVFSKFIAYNKMHKNVKDNIRKLVYPEMIFAI